METDRALALKHLMIDPKYQRRGIGTALIRVVLEMADREALPIWITSSKESFDLYVRMGFEKVGGWTIDNEAWARRVAETNDAAVREGREIRWSEEDRKRLLEGTRGVMETECCLVRWPQSLMKGKSSSQT
jgi:GNAT superfamily N-acetyltransferase